MSSRRVRGVRRAGGRAVPPSPFIAPEGFRLARGRAVLSRAAAGAFLGVTERTVRNWEEGRSKIPYAAFKLLRCYSGFELPHPSWEGFTFHQDTLWGPDGRAFKANDLGQLWNLLSMARFWHQDYERRRPSLPVASLLLSNVLAFPGRRGGRVSSDAADEVFPEGKRAG